MYLKWPAAARVILFLQGISFFYIVMECKSRLITFETGQSGHRYFVLTECTKNGLMFLLGDH